MIPYRLYAEYVWAQQRFFSTCNPLLYKVSLPIGAPHGLQSACNVLITVELFMFSFSGWRLRLISSQVISAILRIPVVLMQAIFVEVLQAHHTIATPPYQPSII